MRPRLALVPGEPAGIGPELCVRLAQREHDACLIAIADPDTLLQAAHALDLPLRLRDAAENSGAGELAVIPLPQARASIFGSPDPTNARAVIEYLNAQIAAGAQAVMIFDTWGGVLADAAFHEFSLAYSKQVLAGLTRASEGRVVPRILFTKGGGAWLEAMAQSGADTLGIDWQTNLGDARRRVGSSVGLQGNLDPMALFAPAPAIEREVERVLSSFGRGPGHVFNLGHGVSQFTPPEHVAALVEAVHSRSLGAHAA